MNISDYFNNKKPTEPQIDLENIRHLCKDDTIIMTQHLVNRIRERGILYIDIKNVIMNGEIIEEYPEDYPHPSCLIFGVLASDKVLHVVVGISDSNLWIITAYWPSLDKWNEDYKTRKEKR